MAHVDDIYEIEPDLSGAGLAVGVVVSRFNAPVCEALLSACLAELEAIGVNRDDMALMKG